MKDKIFPPTDGNDFDGPPEPDMAALFAGCVPPARAVDVKALFVTVAPAKASFFNWRAPMFRRVAALALVTSGVVALIAWLTFFGSGSQISFAAVAEKVAQTQSVTCKTTDGAETTRILVLADGRSRLELPDGNYTIMDMNASKAICVSPRNKTAMIMLGLGMPSGVNVYAMLRNVAGDKSTRLPDETIDGRKANVFRCEPPEEVRKQARGHCEPMKVWVDPETKLPIRMEPFAQDGKPRPEGVMHDFVFDQPLDPALFSFDPPEGYAVTTQGIANLQPPPDKPELLSPEVKPGEGLGPVKFGMSKEEIVKILGKPDIEEPTSLGYPSRGYAFGVSPKRGLILVQFFSQIACGFKTRDFAGKTKEGIGIGSSLKDLEIAFGKADFIHLNHPDTQCFNVGFNKVGLDVTLWDDKVVSFMLQAIRPTTEEPKSDGTK